MGCPLTSDSRVSLRIELAGACNRQAILRSRLHQVHLLDPLLEGTEASPLVQKIGNQPQWVTRRMSGQSFGLTTAGEAGHSQWNLIVHLVTP